mmetsp:Transcript_144398/g.462665  ORF Transcript_144398/g.462665 Transcript_144398/m.462665 type:complete len:237 (-) Transcript_144398:1475-2185(-)
MRHSSSLARPELSACLSLEACRYSDCALTARVLVVDGEGLELFHEHQLGRDVGPKPDDGTSLRAEFQNSPICSRPDCHATRVAQAADTRCGGGFTDIGVLFTGWAFARPLAREACDHEHVVTLVKWANGVVDLDARLRCLYHLLLLGGRVGRILHGIADGAIHGDASSRLHSIVGHLSLRGRQVLLRRRGCYRWCRLLWKWSRCRGHHWCCRWNWRRRCNRGGGTRCGRRLHRGRS